MADWAAWVGLAETGLILAFVALLAIRGIRKLDVWIFTFGIFEFSLATLFFQLPGILGRDAPGFAALVLAFHRFAFATSLFAFLAVYPSFGLSPRKRWFLAWAFIPLGTLLMALLVEPASLVGSGGRPTAFFAQLAQLVNGTAQLLFAVVIGWRLLRLEPGSYRRQFVFLLAPLLFAGINDPLLRFAELGEFPRALVPALEAGVSLAQLAWFLIVLVLLATRSVSRPGPSGADDRVLLGWILAFVPLAFAQFAGPALGTTRLNLHLATDLFSIFLFVYGVARYHLLDVDLRLRWGVRGGVLASVGVAVLLAVQELAQEYVGDALGLAFGAATAGLLVLLLTPLRKAARLLGEAAFPEAGTPGYLAYRRLELYRVALEGVLRDGVLEPREARVLASLREKLGVSMEEHKLLERDARAGVAARPRRGARAPS